MTKRVLAAFLVLVMLLSLQVSAFAGEKKDHEGFTIDLKLSKDQNTSATNKTAYDVKTGKNLDKVKHDKSHLSLSLTPGVVTDGDSREFHATGSMVVDGVTYTVDAKGVLSAVAVNKKTVYLGCLSGYLNGETSIDQWVDLSIHYVQQTNAAIVAVSWGVMDGDHQPVTLDFGEADKDISDAVLSLPTAKTESNDATLDQQVTLDQHYGIMGLTPADTEQVLKGDAYVTTGWGSVASASLWHPTKQTAFADATITVKAAGNTANFERWREMSYGQNVVTVP